MSSTISINPEPTKENLNSYHLVNRPILEHTEEFKGKLRLIDGETKAFYDNSYRYLREAQDRARQLRSSNKELRRRIANRTTTAEFILDQAFQNRRDQIPLNGKITSERAIEVLDDGVAQKLKELNLLKYNTKVKLEKLNKLEIEISIYQNKINVIDEINAGQGLQMQNVRIVENKIDKALMKYNECIHIGNTYSEIKDKLIEEGNLYPQALEALQIEIQRCSKRLKELHKVYQDAALVRDKTKTELQRHEELLYAHRKRRELEITNMRKLVESKKEKVVLQKNLMMEQELRKLDNDVIGEEQEEESTSEPQTRLTNYQTLHEKLKSLTGRTDLEQIRQCFEEQCLSFNKLNEIKNQNETELEQIRYKHKMLLNDFAELKNNYEEKQDRLTRLKVERDSIQKQYLQKIENLIHEEHELDLLLAQIRSVVEHIYNKLFLVRIVSKRERGRSTIGPRDIIIESDPVELLERCLELQVQLETDLEDYNLDEENERMDEAIEESLRTRDEYRAGIERRIPANAMRLRIRPKETTYGEEFLGDDSDAPTREELKQRARLAAQYAKRNRDVRNISGRRN